MKLILKEYLASLKERDELDAILPDLLSQMGLVVYSSPHRGVKEYGVDIGAVGSINNGEEKVYLLSVKSGNLTRDTWNGNANQSLRPSIDEILDAYIPARIPPEHQDKPIEICLCFGGEVHSGIRQEVTGYTNRNSTENIKFSEWNGDKIAELILKYFFSEELAPESHRSLLRKSIAMLDEPDASIDYFKQLIHQMCSQELNDKKEVISTLRQLNIYTWMLFAWGREVDNLESSYVCSEFVLLRAWDIAKKYLPTKGKNSEEIKSLIDKLIQLYLIAARTYCQKIIIPSSETYLGLSSKVGASCAVDVNLKLFDLLGRLSLLGIWSFWQYCFALDERNEVSDEKQLQVFFENYHLHCRLIIATINNNPMLHTPYKDDQALDIMLAVFCLEKCEQYHQYINEWLLNIVNLSTISFATNDSYFSNIDSYEKLIQHPTDASKEYRESVTQGSILLPQFSIVAAKLSFADVYSSVKNLHSEFLGHSNIQLYFFDEDSEKYIYNNLEKHGATLSDVDIQQPEDDLISEIKQECQLSNDIESLSAVKYSLYPVIFMACRHYRLPFPIHYLMPLEDAIEA